MFILSSHSWIVNTYIFSLRILSLLLYHTAFSELKMPYDTVVVADFADL